MIAKPSLIASVALCALLLLGGCGDPVAPECRTSEDCAGSGRCVASRCEVPPEPADAGLEDADVEGADADTEVDADDAEALDGGGTRSC